MDPAYQDLVCFHLTGRRPAGSTDVARGLRSAALAQMADLTELRYDFPLLLAAGSVRSLSACVDGAIAARDGQSDRDRLARVGYQVESHIRRAMGQSPRGVFRSLWMAAADALGEESGTARQLFDLIGLEGELVDVQRDTASLVVRHLWRAAEAAKASQLRNRMDRMLVQLQNILMAEQANSKAGMAPERLRAGVGTGLVDRFDVEALSQILTKAKPSVELSAQRRERIQAVIEALQQQQFVPLSGSKLDPYAFEFASGREAYQAVQDRHDAAVAFVRALEIGRLEVRGDYREAIHDALFEHFGAQGLAPDELAILPGYLVCTDAKTASASELAELLALGMPIKVLVSTDDIVEPSALAEAHVALGLKVRQLVETAISLTDVHVIQACASDLFGVREALVAAFDSDGAALVAVYSGVNESTAHLPAYLVAAAARESRAFPSLVFVPGIGLNVEGNPQADLAWPDHDVMFERGGLNADGISVPFTLADFLAMDDRYGQDYWPLVGVPDGFTSVAEALDVESDGLPNKVPVVWLVNSEGVLECAAVSVRIMRETKLCRAMWRRLQSLGIPVQKPEAIVQAAEAVPASPEPRDEVLAAAAAEAVSSDEPYIETSRCTSCNECMQVNGKMFQYNENKQAYVANPDAGTFRQLVEAAEGCQVSIIHPGKPRNPNEPGLDDLLRRAAVFN